MNVNHLIPKYKYGKAVLAGSGIEGTYNSKAVDCPNVFCHNGRFYMTFIGYDGEGYQTALAVSDDLINWEELGVILKRGANMEWDSVGMAATTLLMDKDLYGGNKLKKWQGKYWLMYHAYPGAGYETGSAEVGLAWTEDENLMDWHFYGEPVFTYKDGAAWESGGMYTTDLVEHDGKFFIFYTAKDNEDGFWTEQSSVAYSQDLIHWTRPFDYPVLPVDRQAWDSQFASQPQVFYDSKEDQWVMFYYGLGNLSACNGLAVSKDLYHWEKFSAPILTTGAAGTIDSIYAHKPYVIWHDGALYHFYCACRPWQEGDLANNNGEFRCISVARTKPWDEKQFEIDKKVFG
ncbi:MAG: hypothetical protein IKC46_14610 [Lachnospiraceae bacterium]|nr:hypothetical protein [Lachnospiraceae bacterium]